MNETVDWRAVLKDYMRSVIRAEGVSFVNVETGPLKEVEDELGFESQMDRAGERTERIQKERTELLAGQVVLRNAILDGIVTQEEIEAVGFTLDPFTEDFWRRAKAPVP